MAGQGRTRSDASMIPDEKAIETIRNRKGTILRLGGYLFKYWPLLGLALVMNIAGNGLALLGPMLSGRAVDAIQPGPGHVDFSLMFHYAALMALFYVISAALSYGLTVVMITVSRKVSYQMRKDVFDKMLSLPVGYYDMHQTGDIISRIFYDVDTVNESLSNDLIQILGTVITVAGSLYMMVLISPALVLVFFISMFWTKYM